MEIIHKNQTEKHKNSENCIAVEYSMNEKEINGAVVEIKGRYPEKGRVVNLGCKEMVYIIKGTGKIVIKGREIGLEEGDMVLIDKKEKYFWDGDFTIFAACTPAWFPEQYKGVR